MGPALGRRGRWLAVAYPAIWKAADWDPHFLDVFGTVMQHTPPMVPRAEDGESHYAP